MRLMDRQFLMRLSIGVNLNRVLITLNKLFPNNDVRISLVEQSGI